MWGGGGSSYIYVCFGRSKIRLIEVNSKCCHLKKMTWKRTLRHMLFCMRPRTLYTVHCICVYRIIIHAGKGGGGRVEPERRLEGQQFTKLGRKYPLYWLYLQSINSDKYLTQSPFTGQFQTILMRFEWCHFFQNHGLWSGSSLWNPDRLGRVGLWR